VTAWLGSPLGKKGHDAVIIGGGWRGVKGKAS